MACDDEYVLLEEHHPPPHHHHHQQHQHQHHHPHQSFPSRFGHKPTPSHPSLSNPLDASSASAVKKVPGASSDDPDDFGDTGFCSQPDSKCPPSFHDAIVGAHCFQDDVHPFPGAAEEEEEEDEQRSRARPEKRKDRDELSDGGTTYCYKRPKPGGGGGGGSGGGGGDYKKDREEWSDSAIACLLDAYTEKYVQLNRGNLRGRDWDEVASIVSDRCNKQKSCKSIEQCKNKVDNLKKRYKAERQRLNNGSLSVSHWPWFKKMEQIVGSSSSSSKAVSDEDKPIAATAVAGSGGSSGLTNSANTPRLSKRYGVSTPAPVGLPNNLKTKSLASPKWRRVVFKISGAALAGNSPQNVDPKVASLIAREVVTANRLGVEVAIVVGGRNFFCGDSWVAATGLDRSAAYQIGMMATVMNSLLLQASIEHLGVQTCLQTAFTMTEIAEPYIRRRAIRHLEKGRVVIFGAGTGLPLFTTDTAAALRASEINAEAVLKGTTVNGVYDCNTRNGSSVAFEHISYRELISRGLNAIMDMTAITLCEDNGLPVVVFNLLEPGNISRALCGDHVGTLIDQSGRIS
ncbi:unnamed protein product [Victoria cruziana]